MYYSPSINASIPTMWQDTGRLNGRNRGKSHLILHCTEKVAKSLYHGIHFTKECMLRSKESPLIMNDEEQSLFKSMMNIPMLNKKYPVGRRLSGDKGNVLRNQFNLVKKKDGGKNINEYEHKVIEEITSETTDDEKSFEKNDIDEIGMEEYTRLTEKMFPKWSNKDDSKISNFMRNLDPDKEYTENEIKEVCNNNGIKILSQLTKECKSNGKTHSQGFGKILKNKNNKYMLYICLISEFKKYF
jgi:hypothetical protein